MRVYWHSVFGRLKKINKQTNKTKSWKLDLESKHLNGWVNPSLVCLHTRGVFFGTFVREGGLAIDYKRTEPNLATEKWQF
jgi:hypothetical protein